jgi:triacylglycerol esterase/lipase EstA (alpha/beta hydrolase family)
MRLFFQSIVGIVVRHQGLAFSLILLFLATPFSPLIYRYLQTSITVLETVGLPEGATGYMLGQLKASTKYKFSSRVRRASLLAVILLPVLFGVVGYLLGNTNPIPKTAVLRFPDSSCHGSAKNLMLFIHGWRGDRLETWQQFPNLVCQDPDLQDFEVISIDYPTYIADRNLQIDETASWIEGNLRKPIGKHQEVAIVAHSIGGLVAREIVIDHNLYFPADAQKIKIMIEIASPHLGVSQPLQMLSTLGLATRLPGNDIVQQVQPESQFLRGLRTHWNSLE